jgi:hypothetical protein
MSEDEFHCPYCIETRPSLPRLQIHVDLAHRRADTDENRKAAVSGACTVTDGTDERLREAGEEIHDLKAKADAVLRQLERLDTAVVDPDVIRRDTLIRVMDDLMSVGNTEGVRLLLHMIDRLKKGDWS